MVDLFNSGISIEKMAAFLEGNLLDDEMKEISSAIRDNPELQQFAEINKRIDDDLCFCTNMTELPSDLKSGAFNLPILQNSDFCPTDAVAACCFADNLCDIRCEGYIIRQFGIDITDECLQAESTSAGWLTVKGTQLKHVGKLAELYGFHVERRHHATINDIVVAIAAGSMVIACVDEGELTGNHELERMEDEIIGKRPDHVVIVSSVDISNQLVTIIDPFTPQLSDSYSQNTFDDAWEDSNHYLTIISR